LAPKLDNEAQGVKPLPAKDPRQGKKTTDGNAASNRQGGAGGSLRHSACKDVLWGRSCEKNRVALPGTMEMSSGGEARKGSANEGKTDTGGGKNTESKTLDLGGGPSNEKKSVGCLQKVTNFKATWAARKRRKRADPRTKQKIKTDKKKIQVRGTRDQKKKKKQKNWRERQPKSAERGWYVGCTAP